MSSSCSDINISGIIDGSNGILRCNSEDLREYESSIT